MNSKLNEISLSAVKLLQQKELIAPDEYTKKMEDIVKTISKLTQDDLMGSFNRELGIVEKMSFEIRTPMNSILGFTGLLKDNYFSLEEKNEFIEMIEKNTEQLVELLNDLSELSRVENLQIPLRIEKFELNVFLLNIISEYQAKAHEKRVDFVKSPSVSYPKDACIYSDPYQLRRILDHLIVNILRFSEKNTIILGADILEDKYLVLKLITEQVSFPETLSQSIKRHITHNMSATSFDGTGLKLTLTRALVDLLNGEIVFQPYNDNGSEFVVTVPVKVCYL